jgi:hypothetical protein
MNPPFLANVQAYYLPVTNVNPYVYLKATNGSSSLEIDVEI